jgi:hypothetical protein
MESLMMAVRESASLFFTASSFTSCFSMHPITDISIKKNSIGYILTNFMDRKFEAGKIEPM